MPLVNALDEVVKRSSFEKLKTQVQEFNQTHSTLKQGISAMPLKFGVSFGQAFLNQGHALVHIFCDGSIMVSHGGVEMGQGLNTRIRQVVAEELRIPLEFIKVSDTSSVTTANTAPTSASSGFDLNAAAVVNALNVIKASIGADFLQQYKDKKLEWPELCHKAWFARRQLSAAGHYAHPIPGFNFVEQTGQPFYYYAVSAIVSHVMADLKTGLSQVLKAELVVDVGQSQNPLVDLG